MTSELKPCPFCGGEAVDFHRRNTGATAEWCGPVDHWVSCTGDCGASTCMHGTKDEAIAAWNTRAEQAAELAKFKALADTLAGHLDTAVTAMREEGMCGDNCIPCNEAREALHQWEEVRDVAD